MTRIKWGGQDGHVDENEDEENAESKKCVLIWQGIVKKPNFKNFHLEECKSEGLARKFLHDKGVEHYWDMAQKANVVANAGTN